MKIPLTKEIMDRGTSIDPNATPETLRTNEMTRRQKRDHLHSRGIKGTDAEELLDKLYGCVAPPSK